MSPEKDKSHGTKLFKTMMTYCTTDSGEYSGIELTLDSASLLTSADKVLCAEMLQFWCVDGFSDSYIQ